VSGKSPFAMPEEPQEVAALIDEAAKNSRHPMVSA